MRAADRAGIHHIELSGGFDTAPNSPERLKQYVDNGFVFKVHNYYPPPADGHFILNIASADEPLRQKSVAFARRAMDLARGLGSDIYSIHSGYAAALDLHEGGEHFALAGNGVSDWNAGLEALARSTHELCEYGARHGMRLALENQFPPETGNNYSYMCSPTDIGQAMSNFQRHDNFGFLLDIGHANISATLLGFDLEDFVAAALRTNRVMDLHISGNQGRFDDHDLPPLDSPLVQLLQLSYGSVKSASLETRNHAFADVAAYYQELKTLLGQEPI